MEEKFTENFTVEEMIKSQTATRLGIDNFPDMEAFVSLGKLCDMVLQPVRSSLKTPVIVTSGYRCDMLNAIIGGAKGSQHTLGEAADFEVIGYTNREVYDWIKDNLEFDQLILEHYNPEIPNSGWVHCSYVDEIHNRNQAFEVG